MPTITEGVEFDTVAREMRCKWSLDNEKASLQALQVVLNTHTAALKAVPGVKGVKRIVCGGCQVCVYIFLFLSVDFKMLSTDARTSKLSLHLTPATLAPGRCDFLYILFPLTT